MAFSLKQNKIETEIKTIRFPVELLAQIEVYLTNDITFSNFVIEACRYALDSLEEQEAKKFREEAKKHEINNKKYH